MNKEKEEAFKRIVTFMASACNACAMSERLTQAAPDEKGKHQALMNVSTALLARTLEIYPNGPLFKADIEILARTFSVTLQVMDMDAMMKQMREGLN